MTKASALASGGGDCPALLQVPATLRYARALLLLAALLHDLGKTPVAFQDKLRKGTGAEVLRHDLLSFLILIESLYDAGTTDDAWLGLLIQDPAAAARCTAADRLLPKASAWLARVERRLGTQRAILLSSEELQALDAHRPGLLTVLWLVLTHHRLPLSSGQGQIIDPGAHLNVPTDDNEKWLAPLSACLEPAPGNMPWQDNVWLAAVSRAAQDALDALADMPPAPAGRAVAFFWPKLAAHLLRPTLVLADHLGSQQATKGVARSEAFGKGIVYANSYDRVHIGDDLTTHLKRVHDNSAKLLQRTLEPSRFPTTTLPADLFDLAKPVPPDFEWQVRLHRACLEAANHGPAFAAVIAETGAGKTIGGLRAAHALSGGTLRLTLAFGLRSLTWQTAKSYLDDIKLDPLALTVAVGQPQTLELDLQARALYDAKMREPRPGSESSEGAGTMDAALDNERLQLDWLDGVMAESEARQLWGTKSLAMLSAPVLACTADHLVSAVSLLKGGDARLFLRLATSDLLLDEIDAYSASDLQSIGKLVFVAGMTGRNVIAMSATLTPAIFQGLFFAWHQGMLLRSQLLQIDVTPALVLCANTVAPQVLIPGTEDEALQAWTTYVERVCAVYSDEAATPRRRRVELCTWTATSRLEAFDAISGIALHAHRLNAVTDPRTGKQVSVGCVRLNTARTTWRYADHLARSGSPDPSVRVLFVPYHSKFPRSYLGVLDASLSQVASRKRGPLAFLEFAPLRAVLDSTPERDVLVLVCSTTLVETGRDLDFDWGICEPMSSRGFVQFVGRIRRHRRGAWSAPNVFILPTSLRALEMPTDGSKPVWSRPGVEDSVDALRLTMAVPAQLASTSSASPAALGGLVRAARVPRGPRTPGAPQPGAYAWQAADALPIELWKQRIDAQVCLQDHMPYASNRIGFVEHRVQARHLTSKQWSGSEAVADSLRRYLETLAPLNALHAQLTRFRGEREPQAVFIPLANGVEYVDPHYGTRHRCLDATLVEVPARHALLPELGAWAAELDNGDPHICGCTLRAGAGGAAMTKLTFSPVLGFIEG